jgi:hypothetical protein
MVERLEGQNAELRQALHERIAISNCNYASGMDLARHVALGADITDLGALTVIEQLRERCVASSKEEA